MRCGYIIPAPAFDAGLKAERTIKRRNKGVPRASALTPIFMSTGPRTPFQSYCPAGNVSSSQRESPSLDFSEGCLGLTKITLSISHPSSHILEDKVDSVPYIRTSCQRKVTAKL